MCRSMTFASFCCLIFSTRVRISSIFVTSFILYLTNLEIFRNEDRSTRWSQMFINQMIQMCFLRCLVTKPFCTLVSFEAIQVIPHLGKSDQGPMLWFLKYFCRKIGVFGSNKAKLCKMLIIITLVFEKNAIYFTENCQKLQKIVIITSTPDWANFRLLGSCLL
jgi:hypothetical protein